MSRHRIIRRAIGPSIVGAVVVGALVLMGFARGRASAPERRAAIAQPEDTPKPPVPQRAFPLSVEDFRPFTSIGPSPVRGLAGVPRDAWQPRVEYVPAELNDGARIGRPLRLAVSSRWRAFPRDSLHPERDDAPGAPGPAVVLETVEMESRPERYAALARGEVDLIWDSLGGFAEAIPRLSESNFQARVVMLVSQGELFADALVFRPSEGATGLVKIVGESDVAALIAEPDFTPRSWAAVVPFTTTHLKLLEELAHAALPASEKWARFEAIRLVESPSAARALFEQGEVVVAGVEMLPMRVRGRRRLPPLSRYIGAGVLIAHPSLLEEGPGSIASLVARWGDGSPAPSSVLNVPTWMQGAFFNGAGAAWGDAASKIWLKTGLTEVAMASAPWFDGRFAPRTRALPPPPPSAPVWKLVHGTQNPEDVIP